MLKWSKIKTVHVVVHKKPLSAPFSVKTVRFLNYGFFYASLARESMQYFHFHFTFSLGIIRMYLV
jgi:hypothetical protein